MNAFKIYLLLFITSTLFFQCQAQTGHEITDPLNQVHPKKAGEVLMLTTSATDSGQISECVLLVASEKGDNNGLLVKTRGATKWDELDSDILHFKYQAGYEYEILMEEERFLDTSKSPTYTLTRVFAKTKKKSDVRKPEEQGLFENTTWHMKEFEGQKVDMGYLQFNGKKVSGSCGCNYMFGLRFDANLKKKRLVFKSSGNGGMTEKACIGEGGLMEREDRLFSLLDEVTHYEATPSELQLMGDQKVLLVLTR